MEPFDLKTTPPDDAALEAWLRSSAALPPLPDDGFSRRVLTALPAPTHPRSSLRLWFCVAGALGGVALVVGAFLSQENPLDRLPEVETLLVSSLEKLSQPAVGLALGVTLLSLGYAYWQELRRVVRL